MRYASRFESAVFPVALVVSLGCSKVGSSPDVDRSVDAYVRDVMAKRHIPGLALSVIRRGQVERVASYGQASLEFSVPVSAGTLFSVASVTKTFTAVGVMKLMEAGKLKLDDSIGTYLGGLPDRWRAVTIRQLLGHTSGLPDVVKSPIPDPIAETPEEATSILRDRPMDFAPGTRYRYNQTNYLLLGLLIEKLSGQPYAQFMQTELFAPAELSDPKFGDTHALIANRGPMYTPRHVPATGDSAADLELAQWKTPPMLYPANALNISAKDLARWLVVLMGERVINRASLEALWTPVRFNDGRVYEIPPSSDYPWRNQGLGWLLVPDQRHPAAGGSGGGSAAFLWYPKDSLAVVVLTNTQGANPDWSVVGDIARMYLGSH